MFWKINDLSAKQLGHFMKLWRQNNKKKTQKKQNTKWLANSSFLAFISKDQCKLNRGQHLKDYGGHAGTEPTQARPVPLWNICPVGNRAAWPALQIGPLWQKCPCGTVTSSLESGGEPHFLIVTQWTQTYQSSLSQNLHCIPKHLTSLSEVFHWKRQTLLLFIYIDYCQQIRLNNAF